MPSLALIMTALANISLVILYLLVCYASYAVLRHLKHMGHADFETEQIYRVFKDMWMLWIVRKKDYLPLKIDGRGWAAAWVAASIFMSSSGLFAFLHFDYLISGDMVAVGLLNSTMWFFTHTLGILGMVFALYAAKHATFTGAFNAGKD